MNRVILIGRLGKDPELKAAGDTHVCNFSVATSFKSKDKENTTWHNCVAWGKTAEIIAQYFKKGSMIALEGRIDNRTYEKDGVTKYISEVVVDKFYFVGGGKEQGSPSQKAEEDLPF